MQFIIIFIFLIIGLFKCNTNELKIDSINPCEFVNESGNCESPLIDKKEYSYQITKDLKVDNMNQLSNYLYFKSRVSSGFIIKFNRPFLYEELDEIKSTFKVYYNFSGTTGKIENVEYGNDYIYSYVYIGTILREKNKEKKEDLKNIGKSLNLSFPGVFSYESSLFKGNINTNQEININKD